MSILIDTDVAIHWRDGDQAVVTRLAELAEIPAISVMTMIELQAGLAGDRSTNAVRRPRMHRLMQSLAVLPFTDAEALAYGRILQKTGYARRQVIDRMIAAQAIVADLTLVTMNGRDFRDIPGLDLEVWPAS